ncbi:glycoside hydrolase family 32 protein [Kineosporia babensis]
MSRREPTEQWRPLVHFTPQKNWMNDPNGLIRHDGVYHLFFQYNATGDEWGSISWGHATSTDLQHWTEHEIAIGCSEDEWIFSGSIVHDQDNTSGLGEGSDGPLIAFYTSQYRDHPQYGTRQAQSIAVSTDAGRTWKQHPDNPVSDRGRNDYRDPKVFWFGERPGGYWVMVTVEADDSRLVINRSDDLLHWTELSTFTSPNLPGFWECPDLFPLPLDGDEGRPRWVLSLCTRGPAQVYLLGDFDGTKFTEDASIPPGDLYRTSDFGHDNYAAVTFSGIPERRLMMGWMGHAFLAPTAPWRGIQTLPRELALVTLDRVPRLTSRFLRELDTPSVEVPASGQRITVPLAYRLQTRLQPGASLLVHASADGDGTRIGYQDGCLYVDRSRSGTLADPAFMVARRVPVALENGELQLDVVVDRCCIEVIAGHGEVVLTELVFPGPEQDGLLLDGSSV